MKRPPKGQQPLSEQQKELLKIVAREAARQWLEEDAAKRRADEERQDLNHCPVGNSRTKAR